MACMLTCAIPMTHNNEGTESIPVEAIELAVIEEKCKEWVASFETMYQRGNFSLWDMIWTYVKEIVSADTRNVAVEDEAS